MKLNNPSGDAISRETIEKVIVGILEKWGDGYPYIEIPTGDAIKIMKSAISEIPPVETKQDELLDYIKLSLKQSDEFKEKYRNKYEESNCQYDLYYSHLFEGMSEAYDDLLKKEEIMKKGKQDRLRGSTE